MRYTVCMRGLIRGMFVLSFAASVAACTTDFVHDPAGRFVAPVEDESDARVDEDAATPMPGEAVPGEAADAEEGPIPEWALEHAPPPAVPPPDIYLDP